MAEFKPINTQEEFDAAIKERIERAERTAEAKFSDYGKLKEAIEKLTADKKAMEARIAGFDAEKSDIQKRLDEANQKTRDLEREAMKTNAAIATGLPLNLRDRLTGNTEEEIKADAENLLKIVGASSSLNLPGFKGNESGAGDSKDQAFRSLLSGFNIKN